MLRVVWGSVFGIRNSDIGRDKEASGVGEVSEVMKETKRKM